MPRAQYPAQTFINGINVGGKFVPGGADALITLRNPLKRIIQLQDPKTKRFLGELEGKTQKAAMVAAQTGAADVRARIQADGLVRTGQLLNSVQAVRRGNTASAVIVSAPHAGILEDGSPPHPINPRNPNGLLVWPASHGGRAGAAPFIKMHPGNRAYNFMSDSMDEMDDIIENILVTILRV